MNPLERILEEEAELEKEVFGTESNPDQESATDQKPEVLETEATTVTPQPELTETTDESDKINSWKERFSKYKASTDKTIFSLRQENSARLEEIKQLRESLGTMHAKLREAESKRSDIFAGVITDEDSELIGPEAVDVMKRATSKATEAALDPLKKKIEQLEAREAAELKRKAEAKVVETYNVFLRDLAQEVPNYAEIDKDPRFAVFMDNIDPRTGVKRMNTFRLAEEYRDAERVAEYFKEFMDIPSPVSKKKALEDHVTPVASSSSNAPNRLNDPKKETFTEQEVKNFFDDIARGVYKKRVKEADEIEARITRAYMNGNII